MWIVKDKTNDDNRTTKWSQVVSRNGGKYNRLTECDQIKQLN